MKEQRTAFLAVVIPLVMVACISLAIVGGLVAWLAAREGTSPSDLVTALWGGRQSARPVLPQSVPLPTLTPDPTATLTPTAAPTVQSATAEATPTPEPTLLPVITRATTAVNTITPSPTPEPPSVEPEPRIEQAIQSPIRPGSPLPERPATRLVIPAIELDIPVIISPIVNQTWQVDHLGLDYVGHLEGTASPGTPSNLVLAGHVTVAHNVYGPFAGLGQLERGDPVIVYDGDQAYTYIVDYRQLVERTNVQVAFPTDTGRVTLITCSNWSDELGAYKERLIVVGHLAGAGS